MGADDRLNDEGEMAFQALDSTHRTDTWFPNQQESSAGTDLWDPDTDDDGLTDGQEDHWVTGLESALTHDPTPYLNIVKRDVYDQGLFDFDPALGTDPNDADTDDDGWWDGWIGVYGVDEGPAGLDVEDADDVVLYIEHANDGDGVSGDEIVQEQTELHELPPTSEVGVNIDSDPAKEHSKLHVGELQWGTDPADGGDVPTPSLDVEVDFLEGSPEQLNTATWEHAVETNYRLYGIAVDLERSDVLSTGLLTGIQGPEISIRETGIMKTRGFGFDDDVYLMVLPQEGEDFEFLGDVRVTVKEPWGGNFPEAGTFDLLPGFNLVGNEMALFVDNIQASTSLVQPDPLARSQFSTEVGLLGGFTLLHEIGHELDIGRADDGSLPPPFGEVYSGGSNPDDPTDEKVISRTGDEVRSWSIMRRGWDDGSLFGTPGNVLVHSFSTEELTTIKGR